MVLGFRGQGLASVCGIHICDDEECEVLDCGVKTTSSEIGTTGQGLICGIRCNIRNRVNNIGNTHDDFREQMTTH